MRDSIVLVLAMVGLAFVTVGCKGSTGPMGPQGPAGGMGTATYLYQNNFDGSGYNPSTEWSTFASAGTMALGLNAIDFLSAPYSLDINSTTGTGVQSFAYTLNGVIPAYTAGDVWVDFFANYAAVNTTSVTVEAELVVNGAARAVFGYAYNSGSSYFYTYNNGSIFTIESMVPIINWHHVQIVAHTNGSADYYDNGMLLVQKIPCGKTLSFSGVPSSYFAFAFPVGFGVNALLIDSFAYYHY